PRSHPHWSDRTTGRPRAKPRQPRAPGRAPSRVESFLRPAVCTEWRPGSAARLHPGREPEGTDPVQAYSQTFTSEPLAKPSLSSPTITKPSARVVDDSTDAPPTDSGSTRSPSTFTRV